MKTTSAVDTARLGVMLNDLRLPTIKVVWPQFAEQADREGWPAARFLAAMAEHELAERDRRRYRIASPEMLPDIELLPHLKCSRAGVGWDSGDEACEHGNAGRTSGGDGRSILGELTTGTRPDSRRVRRHDGISPEARDEASARSFSRTFAVSGAAAAL